MQKEVFSVIVNGTKYIIITELPLGPDPVDHEVWLYGSLLFKINPQLNKCDEPCWTLTKEYSNQNINKELVQKIGEAIERHYL